jgi:hypothetical protein
MTLIVEDGTLVANADSFVTVAEFKTFAASRGVTASAEADDDQVEVALRKAAQYMQQKFRLMWRGSMVEATQSLSWPRRGVPVPARTSMFPGRFKTRITSAKILFRQK